MTRGRCGSLLHIRVTFSFTTPRRFNRRTGEIQMGITSDGVREIFKGLENGDGAAFFEHVADNVDWIVEGTHPLAGHYRSKKAFREGTFAKLSQALPNGAQLHVEDLLVKDDEAVVDLHS